MSRIPLLDGRVILGLQKAKPIRRRESFPAHIGAALLKESEQGLKSVCIDGKRWLIVRIERSIYTGNFWFDLIEVDLND
jgi:hypothetical protein